MAKESDLSQEKDGINLKIDMSHCQRFMRLYNLPFNHLAEDRSHNGGCRIRRLTFVLC